MRGFGELETAIMDRLWNRGQPATVRDLLPSLRERREIAYTTVLTVMDNLYRKGWLRREPAGRANRYAPVITREEYVAQMMAEALADSTDRAQAFLHFVGQMTMQDAAALRSALNAYERQIAAP
jgi:predicted transcriptional regulator